MVFTPFIVSIFTTEEELINKSIPALRMAFAATPLIAINLIGSAYFQSTGKALPALLLTLTKQGFFLIPLILILPLFFGLNGIWMSFPIADCGAALVTFFFLRKQMSKLDTSQELSLEGALV
jgi:Na+-driven multidrug efflux pump